jgi:DNA-binding LacI/PurR family transcriptional regulator
MFALPERISLPAQTTAALRQAIAEGTWDTYLPSERRLAEVFQVSRPTIRIALRSLAKDGWLEIRHGRRNRILRRPKGRGAAARRLVGIVTHQPIYSIPHAYYQGVSEMLKQLATHGLSTEIILLKPMKAKAQANKLELFVRQYRPLCWILLSVNRNVQQWFADRSIPALVLGSCHIGIKLPSLDIDNRSVCRHAAGIFLRHGHRTMALLVRNSGLAGDLASEQGFAEGASRHAGSDPARAIIIRHEGTARNITAKLDAVFRSSDPPTALLVGTAWDLFTVMVYLLQHGLAVPNQVSLVARVQDQLYLAAYPAIAHYRFGTEVYVQRLCRLILKLISHGALPAKPSLIFPAYYEGGSVKAIPASDRPAD